MRKIFIFVGCMVVGLGSSVIAEVRGGSAFGNLTTAQVIGMGNGVASVGVGIADANSISGSFTYGLSEYIDGRIRLAIVDYSGLDNKISLGGDVKYNLWSMKSPAKYPLDLSLGGLFEMVDYGPNTLWQLGGFVVGSYPTTIGQNFKIVPYGRFAMRIADNGFDSGIEFGFVGGAKYVLSSTMDFYAEFQIDGNDGIFLGIDFEVL